MKALVISLESFQKGEVPEEVKKYILSQHGKVFTILDESSKIKTNNPCKDSKKSKRTQAILRLNKIGHRCILTGTFMSKTPINAYDQMNFLKDGFFSESMYAFAERYELRRNLPSVRGARITLPEKDYVVIRARLMKHKDDKAFLHGVMDGIHSFYGISREDCEYIMKNASYSPFKNVDELWNRIGDTCIHLKKEDILDIPPKVYKTSKVELTKEQMKLYLQLQNQHCTDRLTVDNGLKLYLRFQDICNGYEPVETEEVNENGQHKVELIPLKENPKLDMLEELVDEIGDSQIVIWCSRSRLLHDAKDRLVNLGYNCGVYDGKVKREDREKDYEDFRAKKIQILFANPKSAGFGLDGLKEANYAIYVCNSYSVEERLQSEDRIYRGLVSCSKTIFDIQCYGTCEDKIVEALKQGKELLDTGKTDASLFMLEK